MSESRTSAAFTAELARFVSATDFDALPPAVVEQTKKLILDGVGCGLLGGRAETAPALLEVLCDGSTSSDAWIWGTSRRVGVRPAAMTNAAFLHLSQMGEGVSRAVVHPTSTVLPAALALGERIDSTGRDLIRAVALGAEVLIRFGSTLATDPNGSELGDQTVTLAQGWYPPSFLSPIGSATAASLLLGHGREELHNAWGIGCHLSPATTMNVLAEGSLGKIAAMAMGCGSGIVAAELAGRGGRGTADIVGRWMPVLTPVCDPRKLTDGLGERWEVEDVLFKWFAALGPIMAALEAALDVASRIGTVAAATVERVHVEGYRRTVEQPAFDHPTSPATAKANLPHCIAVALLTGRHDVFLHEAFMPEMYESEEVRQLAGRVTASLNQTFDDLYPHRAAKARVTVDFKDGRSEVSEVDRDAIARYHHPTRDDVAAKFTSAAGYRLSPEASSAAVLAAWDIDTARVSEFVGRFASEPAS